MKCTPKVLYNFWGAYHIDYYYPGLVPWAMKSVALAGLMYVVTTHQLLDCFDVLAEGLDVGL